MMRLAGFIDEIADDLDEQCGTQQGLGAVWAEFRSAWGVNVSELGSSRLEQAATTLRDHGLSVPSIGSPVGKALITDDVGPELAKLRSCLDAAEILGASYLRMFSFYLPEGAEPPQFRDEVIARLRRMTELATARGIILLHENEVGTFGDVPDRCRDLLETIEDPSLRMVVDPGNFVLAGAAPYDDGYQALAPWVEYLQVKDVTSDGRTVAAGEGAGQIREIVAALDARGYEGFLSLEPHLGHSTGFGGFTGAAGYRRAWAAMTALLDDMKVKYE